jgi:hypothetical protein
VQINARNPKFSSENTIDLEFEHPVYGWVPFTANPDDVEPLGRELYALAYSGAFGTPDEYVPPPPQPPAPPTPAPPLIPTSVTMRQARLALLGAGLLEQVNAAITDPAAQIEWEYATTVERNSPLVQNLSIGLGLTEQQLDDLFTTAATL